jgi:hypothetical protein
MEATRRGRVGQALRVGKCLRPTFCFGDPQRGAAGEHSRRGNGDPVLTIGMPGGNWRFVVAWRGVGGMMEELFRGRCARGEVAVFERCTCGQGGARRGKSTVHGRTGGGNAIMARATMAGHVLLVYRSNPRYPPTIRSRSVHSQTGLPASYFSHKYCNRPQSAPWSLAPSHV